VGLHLSVALWDTNDTTRRENVEKATAAFRDMFQTQSVVENHLAMQVFFGLLPGNAYQIPERWLTATSDRAACYMHWTSTYKTDPVGEFLVDRYRNLVQINLFNEKLENQNAIVIGPTGTGKSYTFGDLIVQRFEKKARQILLDVGGTYRNVVQSLNGEDFANTYFEYDPERPIEFNPFMVERDEHSQKWLYDNEKTKFHLALLAVLWKGGDLDKSERTILSGFLIEYYSYLNNGSRLGQTDEEFPGMESFYRFVERYDADMQQAIPPPAEGHVADPKDGARRIYQKNLKYIDMHQFFLVLGQFITGGRYAKVLNAARDIDLSDYRLICFDLAKVQNDPDLYPVVAMLITELSLDLFRKYQDDVKYIALDEAWSMLEGVLSDFIESMYRTIRKTKGSVTIITQGINDIVKSKIGKTIITNSDTRIILRHKSEDALMQLQVPLGFTSHEMDLIRSIRSTDSIREIFIKQGGKGKIFGVEASPELDAILTSRAVERNYLNKLVKFYQQTSRRPKTDKEGNILTGPNGEPQYEEVRVQNMAFAVNQFVEDKQARKAAFAK
jgi:conjugal transfer ATP-binding protein TraC